MANRLARPVSFTMEADVVSLFAHLTFGAAGAVTLDQGPYPGRFSKGFCAATLNKVVTNCTTQSSTAVITCVNLNGVFNGMSVTGSGIPASTTVSSVDPVAGTLTLSNSATTSLVATPLTFFGGQYIFQLGTQAGVRLDTYNHLLGVNWNFDTIANGALLTSATPTAPVCNVGFLVGNQVAVRTVPPTVAANLTDATFTMQFGTLAGTGFLAANPASGEILRLCAQLTRSGAI